MNVFETSHLKKSYGKKAVLKDVNLTVREGEIYGLIGKNGAGKTTLMRILLGLTAPTDGEIRINGSSSKDALAYERRKVGAIVDSPSLFLHLTAMENMEAFGYELGEKDENTLKNLMRKVGLDPENPTKVKNYSLGMKQRLAIAVSLIANPSILVLDEPVNGLDPAGIFEVREILQYLNREEKITIIISSHILSELAKLATSYGIMDDGKIVKEMRGSDLEEMCRPYIKLVVGDLKTALNVIVEHYHAHDFEILPYNTLAIYDLSREIPDVVKLFTDANVPIMNVTMCQGDLESTFIALMGGLHDDEK